MRPAVTPLAYTIQEAADAAGVSERFIRNAIKSTDPKRGLRAKRLSNTTNGAQRILASELQRWLEALPDA